jgi:hypothetical protein
LTLSSSTPAGSLSAASKTYVDTSLSTGLATKQNTLGFTPVNKAGDTLTGALLLAANPTVALGAATKQYVDSAVSGGELGFTPVNKAGDTMTGLLVLSANPSAALGAATKQYVDTGLATKQASLGFTPINKAGDTGVGSLTIGAGNTLTLAADPALPLQASTKAYVDTGLATKQATLGFTPVNKAGDTMTGLLVLSGDATSNLNPVTKQQLDAATSVKAWVNFNGGRNTSGVLDVGGVVTNTSRLIRSSLNVASVVRIGVGEYTINFATPIVDANYIIIGSGSYGSQQAGNAVVSIFPDTNAFGAYFPHTISSFRVLASQVNVSSLDPENVYISIIR